jgi:hypothetical protein
MGKGHVHPLLGQKKSAKKRLIKMGLIKNLRELLYFKGKLPKPVRWEAYELYEMGSDFVEIENMIEVRTRTKRRDSELTD